MDYQISLQTRKIASPQSEGYTPLWFGYVDESGDPAAFSQQPLVLTAIMTQTPRALELIARRASKKVGIKKRSRLTLGADNHRYEIGLGASYGGPALPGLTMPAYEYSITFC